jgi:hypothetical protein
MGGDRLLGAGKPAQPRFMSGGLVVIGVWLVLLVMITALIQHKSRARRRRDSWGAGEDGTQSGRAGCGGGGGSCGGGCGGSG